MKQEVLPYTRRVEILRILFEHGPLCARGLRAIIQPPMKHRRIGDATRRLCKRGYVIRRFDGLPNNVGHFYQLSHRQEVRKEIAELLGMKADDLKEPIIHDQELNHSQDCAIWTDAFKRLYPEARIIRDHQIATDPQSLRVLLTEPHIPDLKPDIMLFFPKGDGQESSAIAIEIERSRKTHRRIIKKLKKYATRTHLDGLIYVSSYQSIIEVIHRLYESKVLPEALRVKHYGRNFLMFLSVTPLPQDRGFLMLNSNKEDVYSTDWINILRTTHRNFRRDAKFNPSAQPS